jgi:hypothetical protein
MDETSHRLFWILGSGGFGAVLGSGFGAAASALSWSSGRPVGTALGQRVAAAFANAGDQDMSPTTRGAIIGATDGSLFLGVVGIIVGILFALAGTANEALFIPLAIGGFILMLAAAFFGVLAYAVVRNGIWAVVGLFFGGLAGALGAALAFGVDHFLLGVVPGLAAGTLATFLWGRYQPSGPDERVAKPLFEKWRQSNEGIQTDPLPGRDSDAFPYGE